VIPAGAIPYFSELVTIDMLGINDLTIGHKTTREIGRMQAGHEKHDVEYVLSRKPTYVILGIYGLEPELLPPKQIIRPFYPAEIELLRSSKFHQQYKVASAKTEDGYFYYFVLIDKDKGKDIVISANPVLRGSGQKNSHPGCIRAHCCQSPKQIRLDRPLAPALPWTLHKPHRGSIYR